MLVLAILSFWISQHVQTPPHQVSGQKLHQPDYFMENFVSTKTDKSGQLKAVLAAVKMFHYPDDDSTHLVRPRLTQYSHDGHFNQIEAQRGLISSDGESAQFYDNVIVFQPAKKDRGDMHMFTNYLKVLPKANLASTPEEVKITESPYSYMTGVGMVFDKKKDEITLQKRVKIHYLKGKGAIAKINEINRQLGNQPAQNVPATGKKD
jgi:lipopolysaccharide export system protein LptC